MTTVEILSVIACAGWGFCAGLAWARGKRLRLAESRAEAAELAAAYHRSRADVAECSAEYHHELSKLMVHDLADLEDELDTARESATRMHRRAQCAESETARLRRDAVGLWRAIAFWKSESQRLGWRTERDAEYQVELAATEWLRQPGGEA